LTNPGEGRKIPLDNFSKFDLREYVLQWLRGTNDHLAESSISPLEPKEGRAIEEL